MDNPGFKYESNLVFGPKLPEGTGLRDRRKSSVSALNRDNDQPYRGMGKEDLLRHSGKPFWRRLRYICMSVVMVGWLALIITVVALVLVYPRCRTPPHQSWWKKAVVYRIYVRSFQDHDGDGIGDLEGIKSQLRYLNEIGINTISLSPIYPTSPDSDSDTEIIDHMNIAQEYGNIAQFVSLVNASHAWGINVVMDFIPNHTGLDHPWFKESRNSTVHKPNIKRNYYVWEDGLGSNSLEPPNNWWEGGSAANNLLPRTSLLQRGNQLNDDNDDSDDEKEDCGGGTADDDDDDDDDDDVLFSL
ncbi:amino acid transporter heavy chain SLC3A1-like [Littorina saxatilis]|uniref:amino acid transporter heavy chain SLC3A1-like n=1 Tax=Littorina saxatilis TaxID=31220 RepID=UPI0038B4D0A6